MRIADAGMHCLRKDCYCNQSRVNSNGSGGEGSSSSPTPRARDDEIALKRQAYSLADQGQSNLQED